MAFTAAVTDKIKTFKDLQDRCNLNQTNDIDFFTEWIEDLPDLTDDEKTEIASIKEIYDYQRLDGFLLEGTINLLIVSPLLRLAGFFKPPYKIRSPYGVELEIDDPEETIRGFIDALVIKDQLWVLVVEGKRNGIPVAAALPQLIAYMLSQTHQRIIYGLATNGDEFLFIKLETGENGKYDYSTTFSLLPTRHELGRVLQILKRLGTIIALS